MEGEDQLISIEEVDQRISMFKSDLEQYDDEEMIQKYFEHSLVPAVMSEDDYFQLKKEIANHFTLHPSEVIMVGSAKLGFTIKPQSKYRKFGDSSDIDIAIISEELFENIWRAVFEYKNDVKYWGKEQKFKDYLFRGWIRPDLLPHAKRFELAQDWWDFFLNLSSSGQYGPYRIRAGLYYSRYFFEPYQTICINACRHQLDLEV